MYLIYVYFELWDEVWVILDCYFLVYVFMLCLIVMLVVKVIGIVKCYDREFLEVVLDGDYSFIEEVWRGEGM